MMQSLVYQDVIGKRMVALQQIRKGMEILGFLDVLAKNADHFEPLFVYKADQLTFSVFAEKLSFSDLNEEHHRIHDYLIQYLQEADTKKLEAFIHFCTGCKALPLQNIRVVFSTNPAVLVSKIIGYYISELPVYHYSC